mmetsp:Transcript_17396/g.35934  ORF Transcript_17396/g.35934 Transcript_17396/m.35934 type:complete len:182 (-) Transcript_17396:222-767(-)
MSTSLPATGVGAGVAAFARTESNEGATILGANVLELTGVATKEVGTEVVKEEGEVRGIEEGREEEFVFFVDGVEVVGGLEVLDSGIDARSETADFWRFCFDDDLLVRLEEGDFGVLGDCGVPVPEPLFVFAFVKSALAALHGSSSSSSLSSLPSNFLFEDRDECEPLRVVLALPPTLSSSL